MKPSRTTWVLVSREVRAAGLGATTYFVAAAAILVAAVFVKMFVSMVYSQGMQIITDPLRVSTYLALAVLAIYMAVSSTTSISRERDTGTLEVLFYGPVSTQSFLAAKFVEQMLVYAAMACAVVTFLVCAGALCNLPMGMASWVTVGLSFLSASVMIALGIFLSCLTSRVRTSILVLIAVVVLFLGIQLGSSVLANLGAAKASSVTAWAAAAVGWVAWVLGWVSPFAYADKALDAIMARSWARLAVAVVLPLLYTALFLWLGAVVFRRRGVRS